MTQILVRPEGSSAGQCSCSISPFFAVRQFGLRRLVRLCICGERETVFCARSSQNPAAHAPTGQARHSMAISELCTHVLCTGFKPLAYAAHMGHSRWICMYVLCTHTPGRVYTIVLLQIAAEALSDYIFGSNTRCPPPPMSS